MSNDNKVQIPFIYYFRLFKTIGTTVEIGSDFFIGNSCYDDTLDKALAKIKTESNTVKGKWNAFEIYKIEPTCGQIAQGLIK